jgi:hypothetical protein
MYGVMLGLELFLGLDKGFRCLPGIKLIWMDENTAMPNYVNEKTNISFLTPLIEQQFFPSRNNTASLYRLPD